MSDDVKALSTFGINPTSPGLGLIRKNSEGEIDISESLEILLARYPNLRDFTNAKELLEDSIAAARSLDPSLMPVSITGNPKDRHQADWLFNLAGLLRSRFFGLFEAKQFGDLGFQLVPFALAFVDALILSGKIRGSDHRIDWLDEDAISLEFEEVWKKRHFTKGSEILELAAKYSENNHLQISGNRHFVRVLNVAYFLQQNQPDHPIIIPVSSRLADLLGMTGATLSTAVSKAIREGFLKVVDGSYSIQGGKARKLRLDLDALKVIAPGAKLS